MSIRQIIYTILIGFYSISSYGQPIKETVEGNNTFAFEIFKEVFSKDENVFLSPYSISSALAMTYAGARNETEQQMSKILHYDLHQKITHEGFLAIEQKLNKFKTNTAIKLSVANALWKDDEWNFKPDYLELINTHYNASVFSLTDAKAINDWVKKETNGKIDKLVEDADVASAKLVLTNAIYFKGDWLSKFNEKYTKKDSFTTIENNNIIVDMMFQWIYGSYFEDEQIQMLELPYKDELMSMMILLPKPGNSIINLVNSIDSKLFEEYVHNFTKQRVKSYIPKYSFKSSFELSAVLTKMGMPDAFSQVTADFSGMSSDIFINKVIHKSFVEVNEKGSEAAAATAVGAITSDAQLDEPKIFVFKADRPFMFLIRDNQTKSILFIGSILNPNQ